MTHPHCRLFQESAVADIHNFALEHNMKLNPIKYKETFIIFLRTPNFPIKPLQAGSHVVQQDPMSHIISNDLSHMYYIIKKASKKLYS